MASMLERLESRLEINEHDLNGCLVEEADLFYQVAKEHALAVAERDQAKLALDEAMAKLDLEIRARAVESDTKVTENLIANQIKIDKHIMELNRDYLGTKKDVDAWAALKDAFDKRSYSLGHLVDREIGYLHRLGLEKTVRMDQSALSDHRYQETRQELDTYRKDNPRGKINRRPSK